jgi:hypothetical protein
MQATVEDEYEDGDAEGGFMRLGVGVGFVVGVKVATIRSQAFL